MTSPVRINKVKTSTVLDKWQDEALDRISRETGLSRAMIVRRALSLFLSSYSPHGHTDSPAATTVEQVR